VRIPGRILSDRSVNGKSPSGDPGDFRRSFVAARAVLLRGLGLVYAAAFASFWTQAAGLVGERGILPAGAFLDAVRSELGGNAWPALPTVFWLRSDDLALHLVCALGLVLAVALALGYVPRLAAFGLWALYLSISQVGQIFLGYQWDALLLEAGLLAIWLAPSGLRPRGPEPPPRAALFLVRWLVFRLFLLSGLVKLLSGDPSWRNFSALGYHYWTQPIPTWTSAIAHAAPAAVHTVETAGTLAVEIGLPFLVFGPRPLRLAAAAGFTLLQLLINATGNYGFFGLLTVVLCASLVDDAVWRRVPGIRRLAPAEPVPPAVVRPWQRAAATAALGFVLVVTTALALHRTVRGIALPEPVRAAVELVEPLRSFNAYGLFATMTKDRLEIEVEGSRDGRNWLAYEFRYKPDRLDRRPPFTGLHMPRLDWQMWFAALATCADAPWFLAFQRRLLQASPPVLGLLARDPFAGEPPRYLRSTVYRYRFTDAATRRATGNWWEREELGPYCPTLELAGDRLRIAEP
jgi:hypothetical protein